MSIQTYDLTHRCAIQEVIENEFLAALSSAEKPPHQPSPCSIAPPAMVKQSPSVLNVAAAAATIHVPLHGDGGDAETETDPSTFTNAILAQLYDEQQQRHNEHMLRQRRPLPVSYVTQSHPPISRTGATLQSPSSSTSTDNDTNEEYEDIELGKPRPPRRKRSRSTGDYETVSFEEMTATDDPAEEANNNNGTATSTAVRPEIVDPTRATLTLEVVTPADPVQLTSAQALVNERIEAIQMCPLDVSSLSVFFCQ